MADTLGMLDERPLVTMNMMYDPDVDALGLELLAVQALLSTSNVTVSTRFCRDRVSAACWALALTGSMWLRCASGFKRRGDSGFPLPVSFMGGMGFQSGSLMILRASFMPRRSAPECRS
ncbi:MAG: hypothetical protein ACLU0O_12635 [Collinsella sp.]